MTDRDQLHAAAPDLLAALRGLLPHVPVPASLLGPALGDDPCPLPDYIRAAHDAISKATGNTK